MGGGGKGDKQESKVELPKELREAAERTLEKGEKVSQLGYQPNRAVTIAGFTPMQQSSMQNTANAANAFGLGAPTNAMVGMPATQTSAGGIQGYSTAAGYDEAVAGLPQGYRDYLNSFFIDPNTGKPGSNAKSEQPQQSSSGKGLTDKSQSRPTMFGDERIANALGQVSRGK